MLKKTDFLWLLAYPVYQIVGTIRHEGSHALAAVLEGARLQQFVFLPSLSSSGRWLWGYVEYQGRVNGWVTAAPYLVDLLTYAVFFGLCYAVLFRRRWVWLNLVIFGLISPLINSAYNYLGGLSGPNDVGQLLAILPNSPVHLYFIGTLSIYLVGLVRVFRSSATAKARCAAS
jgi:hypothetical protein